MKTMRPEQYSVDPLRFIQNSRFKTHRADVLNPGCTRITKKVREADMLAPGLGLADWKQKKIEKEIIGK